MAHWSPHSDVFRLLLDENFPEPPGFDPERLDRRVRVTKLRAFDPTLVGRGTPDWYLYLRAHEAKFNALVTRDWHQSGQAEELWALTRTRHSVVTWSHPLNDSVAEWGQLLAYMTEILRMIAQHGHCVVLLPRPRLDKRNILHASDALGVVASDEGRSNKEVRDGARQAITEWLDRKGERERFAKELRL